MIDIISGVVAIGQVGYQKKYWVGVVGGNHYCKHFRRTSEKAIEDAFRLKRKILKKQKEIK